MTEQNIELLQQRIGHLEKLADDAGKTLTFQQSRIDLLTAERDQLIEKNNRLVAESNINLQGAARELNTSWMMHKTMMGAQAALLCLSQGDIRSARDWLEGTTDEAFIEMPDDMMPPGLQAWFDSNMTSNDGGNGFLTQEEALEKLRQRVPDTEAAIAAIRAEGRAEGVEMFVEDFTQPTGLMSAKFFYEDLADSAKKFASDLRQSVQVKGVQS